MQKTAIAVFDIDGTLTDSIPQHQEAFEAALRHFGFPALRTDWAAYRHHTDSGIFAEAWDEAGFAGAPDLAGLEARFAPRFAAAVARRPIAEITGAAALLRALEGSRWAVAFATGSLAGAAHTKLAAVGRAPAPGELVTASEHESREAIVAQAIENARQRHGIGGAAPVVSVGDGVWDAKTARALGVAFLGVGAGEGAARLQAAAPGAPIVQDLTDGLAVLERAL